MFKHNWIEWATLDWSAKSLRKYTFKPLEEKKFGAVVLIIRIYCCEIDFERVLMSPIHGVEGFKMVSFFSPETRGRRKKSSGRVDSASSQTLK